MINTLLPASAATKPHGFLHLGSGHKGQIIYYCNQVFWYFVKRLNVLGPRMRLSLISLATAAAVVNAAYPGDIVYYW